MHEFSLVKSLLRQVNEIAEQHGATCVEEVKIEIGPLTGVEKILVQEAFELLSPDLPGSDCRLTIIEVPLQAICNSCGKSIVVQNFQFQWTACVSPNIRITSGDAFRLLDVTIDTELTTGVTEP